MIKKLLSVVLFVSTVGVANSFAQANCTPDISCVPTDSVFGICPDSMQGIPAGTLNQAYTVTMSLKVPTESNGTTVSHLALTDVLIDTDPTSAENYVSLTTIGLDYLGNGSNTLQPGSFQPANFTMTKYCVWDAGTEGCVIVSGTPTMAGTFPIRIKSRARVSISGISSWTQPTGTASVPDNNDYKLVVAGPSSIELLNMTQFDVAQNAPNPFNAQTEIHYSSVNAADIDFKVYNVVGAVVYSENFKADKGANVITLKANSFAPGTYMYTVKNGNQVITKRMVVTQ